MDGLLNTLNARRPASLNLPPCHSATSLYDLVMQPELQKQPIKPLFVGNEHLMDKLPVIALPHSPVLVAARTPWPRPPSSQSPDKKHHLLSADSESKKRTKQTADNVTIQHY